LNWHDCGIFLPPVRHGARALVLRDYRVVHDAADVRLVIAPIAFTGHSSSALTSEHPQHGEDGSRRPNLCHDKLDISYSSTPPKKKHGPVRGATWAEPCRPRCPVKATQPSEAIRDFAVSSLRQSRLAPASMTLKDAAERDLRGEHNWIASVDLQRIVAEKTSHTPQNVRGRLRELTEERKFDVMYVRNHAAKLPLPIPIIRPIL
jgi:hypothetical protein